MIVRLGIPASFPRFTAAAREMGAPILVSANALRRPKGGGFYLPKADKFNGCDVVLDSAGYVAMVLYGGYLWTVAEYVTLANSYPWTWYASMDFCCEREIAADRETVMERVAATAHYLKLVQDEAAKQGAIMPMPVLQGWLPADYIRCADLMGDLPELVGIGSVCRRHLRGPDGLIAVLEYLDRRLPRNVTFHLFGVKGDAIEVLRGHPRIKSTDSLAWDYAARRDRGDEPYSIETRIKFMRRWYQAQMSRMNKPAWSWQASLPFNEAFA